MAQVTTVREVKAHETTVRRHDGLVDLKVGRAARQALDVDTPFLGVEVESGEGTLLAEELDAVNVLVATVVAGTRVTLGVLVAHGGAEGVKDGTGGDVLGGNENNGLALTLDLIFLWTGKSLVSLLAVVMVGFGGANEACLGRSDSYHDGGDLGVRLEERLFEHLQTGVRDFMMARAVGEAAAEPSWKPARAPRVHDETNLLVSGRQRIVGVESHCSGL